MRAGHGPSPGDHVFRSGRLEPGTLEVEGHPDPADAPRSLHLEQLGGDGVDHRLEPLGALRVRGIGGERHAQGGQDLRSRSRDLPVGMLEADRVGRTRCRGRRHELSAGHGHAQARPRAERARNSLAIVALVALYGALLEPTIHCDDELGDERCSQVETSGAMHPTVFVNSSAIFVHMLSTSFSGLAPE